MVKFEYSKESLIDWLAENLGREDVTFGNQKAPSYLDALYRFRHGFHTHIDLKLLSEKLHPRSIDMSPKYYIVKSALDNTDSWEGLRRAGELAKMVANELQTFPNADKFDTS